MAIKQLYVDQVIAHMQTLAKSARITINGAEKDYEIFKTLVEGKTFKHFVYLTNEVGNITEAKLLDAQGRELQTKSFSVTKGEDGFVVAFVITIEIKEA